MWYFSDTKIKFIDSADDFNDFNNGLDDFNNFNNGLGDDVPG